MKWVHQSQVHDARKRCSRSAESVFAMLRKTHQRGRLVGETWVPLAGLHAGEWATYVRALAWSCDRLEYLLTGRDED